MRTALATERRAGNGRSPGTEQLVAPRAHYYLHVLGKLIGRRTACPRRVPARECGSRSRAGAPDRRDGAKRKTTTRGPARSRCNGREATCLRRLHGRATRPLPAPLRIHPRHAFPAAHARRPCRARLLRRPQRRPSKASFGDSLHPDTSVRCSISCRCVTMPSRRAPRRANDGGLRCVRHFHCASVARTQAHESAKDGAMLTSRARWAPSDVISVDSRWYWPRAAQA